MSSPANLRSVSPPASRLVRLQTGLTLLFLLLFLAYAYTFLHEGGHALLGLLFGGRLTSFSVDFIRFTAHVGLDGEFTRAQDALISIAGVGLPLILWTLYLLLAPKTQEANPLRDWLFLTGSAVVYSTLLAWVIIPVLLLAGLQVGDDSATFTRLSGIHPLFVSAGALALFCGGIALLLRRTGGLPGLRVRLFTIRTQPVLTPAGRRLLGWLAALLVVLVVATLALQVAANSNSAESLPAGYAPAFETGFSDRAWAGEAVYRLHLDQPAQVGFYLILENFQRGPLEITLTGPHGYSQTFLRSENDPQIGRATVSPQPFSLEAGDYALRVLAPRAPARLRGYVQITP
jgi:hypothetical protein